MHAWINVNLVSSAVDLPIARDHLVYRHPEWLMVPREIAQDVAKVAVDSPAYVGKLARWTRAQTGRARRPLRLADRARPPPTTFRPSCAT